MQTNYNMRRIAKKFKALSSPVPLTVFQDGGKFRFRVMYSMWQVQRLLHLDFRWKESRLQLKLLLMETYRRLEELKESIGRDFRGKHG